MLHIRRVTTLLLEQLTRKTSRYGLSPQDIELIGMASTLHDIGKLGISDAILNKPGPLNEEEKAIMRTHTVIGESILKGMEMYEKEPLLKTAAKISPVPWQPFPIRLWRYFCCTVPSRRTTPMLPSAKSTPVRTAQG